MKRLTFILLVFVSLPGFGQFQIAGKIRSEAEDKPVPYAAVSLLLEKDSTVVALSLSDSLGFFKIDFSTRENTLVHVNSMGFHSKTIAVPAAQLKTVSHLVLPDVLLAAKDQELATVLVTAERPLITRMSDRFVVEVGKSVMGSSAWDILKQTPLVIADEQGSLGLLGKQSVAVYINGRKTNFSGEALFNFLKSMPPDNVERIELITTPGSNFDAAGNGGVINLILRKPITDGVQGRVSLADVIATSHTIRGNGILFYRKGDLGINASLYGNQINQRYQENSVIDFRQLGGGVQNVNRTTRHEDKNFYGGNIGADYNLRPNHVLGLSIDYGFNRQDLLYSTSSTYAPMASLAVDSVLESSSRRRMNGHSLNLNANYQITLNSSGRVIDVNADYFDYLDDLNQQNISITRGEPVLERDNHISTLPQQINNYTLSVNYTHPFNPKTQLQVGGKAFQTTSDNNLYFGVKSHAGLYEQDLTRSNYFQYRESVHAMYLNTRHRWSDKLETSIGMRVENTISEGKQVTEKQSYPNDYISFFPNAFVSYALHEKHQLSYSITSRINRPYFGQLNPFRFYQTPTIYMEGNPFLKPSRIYKNELTYALNGRYTFILNQSVIRDDFSQFVSNVPGSNSLRYKPENYGSSNQFNLAASMHESFWNGRLSTAFTGIVTRAAYKGEAFEEPIAASTVFGRLQLNNTINLSKKAALTGYANWRYTAPQRVQLGLLRSSSALDIGLRKVIKDVTVIVYGTDILKTSAVRSTLHMTATDNYYNNYYDQRSLQLSLSYGFGNNKIKHNRRRESSNSEIRNRSSN